MGRRQQRNSQAGPIKWKLYQKATDDLEGNSGKRGVWERFSLAWSPKYQVSSCDVPVFKKNKVNHPLNLMQGQQS